MSNSITNPEVTISLTLLHIWKTTNGTAKNVPCFFCSGDLSLLHSLVGMLNLEVHTAGNILFSRSVVISSQGRREAIKSKSLQVKLYRVDE